MKIHGVVFAATSHYISETVQASTKVTIECEYEVVCSLSKWCAMTLNDR